MPTLDLSGLTDFEHLVVLSFFVAYIALVLTKSTIMRVWRNTIKELTGYNTARPSKFAEAVASLIECPFCMSFWIALLLCAVDTYPSELNVLTRTIAVAGASSLIASMTYMGLKNDQATDR